MQAVIFDLDGTLADSEPVHGRALQRVLAPLGIPVRPEDYVGLPDRACIESLLTRHGHDADSETIQALLADKQAIVLRALRANRPKLFKGAGDLVRDAASRWSTALCTASRRDEAMAIICGACIDDQLSVVVAAEDVERTKPDPACYLEAARRLGVEPQSCLAIEDSVHGVRAARDAGLRVVGVAHSCPADRLDEADAVYTHISEIDPDALDAIAFTGSGRR